MESRIMPRRAANWTPALSHRKREGRGRVRIPDKGDVYLGKPGCWPAEAPRPPREVTAAYDREIAAWLTRRAEGTAPERGPGAAITVCDLILAYKAHAEEYYRKNGHKTSELSLMAQASKPLADRHGSELADDFTPLKLKAYLMALAKRGLSRHTANGFTYRVKRIFKWGTSEGLVAPGVWNALLSVASLAKGRSMAREPAPIKPVPDEWIEATAKQAGRYVADALRLQRLAGMRPCEVCALAVSLIDRTGEVWTYKVEADGAKLEHKEVVRIVYLGPQSITILKPLIAEAEKAGRDFLLQNRYRTVLKSSVYAERVRNAAEAAGLPRWSPNRVRHTAGTEFRRTHGLEGAAAMLGHSELKTTQIYAERDAALGRKIASEQG